VEKLLGQVRECLVDDLDTPGALAAIDAWATLALSKATSARASSAKKGAPAGLEPPTLLRALADALLGVTLYPPR
jgi:L-cysteine:1D-myo-inositol 2-amino-2-deoxy-alpha-D-glucopyranoside ligase